MQHAGVEREHYPRLLGGDSQTEPGCEGEVGHGLVQMDDIILAYVLYSCKLFVYLSNLSPL